MRVTHSFCGPESHGYPLNGDVLDELYTIIEHLNGMRGDLFCCEYLADTLGLSPINVMRHLEELENGGVVTEVTVGTYEYVNPVAIDAT